MESKVEHLWAEIETRHDELVGVIADLVGRPSLLGEEGPAQAYVADHLRASGMTTEVWELDQSVRDLPNTGDSGVPFAGRPNVEGTLPGRGRRGAGRRAPAGLVAGRDTARVHHPEWED